MGKDRMLVRGACQARGADCTGIEARRHRDQLGKAIHENRAEEVLNWINVYAGEMIYVAGEPYTRSGRDR